MGFHLNEDQKAELRDRLMPLYEFSIHLIVGSIIFIIVALVAVGLGAFIDWIDVKDEIINLTLRILKYTIFGTDCLLYVIFLVFSVTHTAKNLWKR